MIHILLLILKIIGIILLSLIAIVLLILLFPVTYSAKGSVDKKGYKVKAGAGWLFHILHISFSANSREWNLLLRVLGIPINIKKIIEKDKAVQSGENENKKEGTKDRKPHLEHMDTVEDSKTESGESKKSLTEDSITKESITKRITGEHRKKEDKNKQKHDKNSFKKRIKNILRKICNIIRKIKEYIYLKFFDIKDMYDKVAEFNKFIKSKTTKEAYRFAKRIIIKLIKHIFPSKIKGNLHFGFDEPDKTGKTLGYIAMIFQVFNVNIKKIKIEPDFDKKIFEGNVSVKGHFVIGLVLIYVLRLYFKREIRLVVKIKLRQK